MATNDAEPPPRVEPSVAPRVDNCDDAEDKMMEEFRSMILEKRSSEYPHHKQLTEPQIYHLLVAKPDGYLPLLYLMILHDPTAPVKLLAQITDENHFTQIVSMEDICMQNPLSWAVEWSNLEVVRYIYSRVDRDNLYKLLRDRDQINGDTALHKASWQDYPLDELLEPFTTEESQELLSIKNNYGITAVEDIQKFLKRREISLAPNHWPTGSPSDVVIARMAKIMEDWEYTNLDRLNLTERLTAEQIAELLKIKPGQKRLPVLYRLILHNTTAAMNLTQAMTNEQFTQIVSMKDCDYRINSLNWAVWRVKPDMVKSIFCRIDRDKLYKLLSDPDEDGNTALHKAAERDYPLDELLEQFTATESHELVSIRNKDGQTVLSYTIEQDKIWTFRSLIATYFGRESELLELISISDNEGYTSFHYAAGQADTNYLTGLLRAGISFRTRRICVSILEKKNATNKIVKPSLYPWSLPAPASSIIYQWALGSIRKRQYLLFDYPKVVIFWNEANREGAKKEAVTFIQCFRELGFKVDVRPNRRKRDMLEDLKEASKSKMGLIVAILSHGAEGCIFDNDGERIAISELEEFMTHHNIRTPKCLIVQACQGFHVNEIHTETLQKYNGQKTSSYAATYLQSPATLEPEEDVAAHLFDAGPSYRSSDPYFPRTRNFCVFMSTIPGGICERNLFIPSLVNAFEQLGPDDCISEAYSIAASHVYQRTPYQNPLFISLMIQKFSFKNALPSVLKRANESKEKETVSKDPWREALIRAVRDRPGCYNQTSPEYYVASGPWEQVVRELAKQGFSKEIPDVMVAKSEWQSLMNQYRRKMRDYKADMKSGSVKVAKPRWPYWDLMSWAEGHLIQTPSHLSLPQRSPSKIPQSAEMLCTKKKSKALPHEPNKSASDHQASPATTSMRADQPINRKRKAERKSDFTQPAAQHEEDHNQQKETRMRSELTSASSSGVRNKLDLFGRSVTEELRGLDDRKFSQAKIKIMTLIDSLKYPNPSLNETTPNSSNQPEETWMPSDLTSADSSPWVGDRFDLFGCFVTEELRGLDDRKFSEAKIKIMTLIDSLKYPNSSLSETTTNSSNQQ